MPFLIPREPYLSTRWLQARRQGAALPILASPGRRYPFFLARNALFHGLRALGLRPGDRVLVPGYVCTVVVEAIESYGAAVDFHEVLSDCRVDLEDCRSRITADTRAILVVHHFGFVQPLFDLRELCRQHSLRLIEDCAHVITGSIDTGPLGTHGDIAVFSWRKFMPIHDGGILVLNDPTLSFDMAWIGENLRSRLGGLRSTLEIAYQSGRTPLLRAALDTAAALRCLWRRRRVETAESPPPVATEGISSSSFDSSLIDRPMSDLSRWIFERLDLSAIVARRRENYIRLAQGLGELEPFELLHPELPEGVCPWLLPLRLRGVRDAHREFRDRGIPASHWGDVRPPRVDPSSFPTADGLYRDLFFLPIHQDLTGKDLDTILSIAGSIADRLGSPSATRSVPQPGEFAAACTGRSDA